MIQQEINGASFWTSRGPDECSKLKMSADLHDLVNEKQEAEESGVLRMLDHQTATYWLLALTFGEITHVEAIHDAPQLPVHAVTWTPGARLVE